MTGRPRGYYRKFKMSRIALRDLGLERPDPRHGQVELVRRRESIMAMSDPLGDMLTRIRNGQRRARPRSSHAPPSKLRANVLDVLKREGYIRGYEPTDRTARRGKPRSRSS